MSAGDEKMDGAGLLGFWKKSNGGSFEGRYRALVDACGGCVCSWLPDTTLTFVSKGYCDYFGRTEEDLLGRQWLELIPEAKRDEVQGYCSRLVKNPENVTYQHIVVDSEGRTRWMEWTDSPVMDSHGKLLGFESLGRDITDSVACQHAMEDTIRISEERFRTIVESTYDCIVVWDRDLTCLYVNQAAQQLWGVNVGRIEGKSFEDIVGGDSEALAFWNSRVQGVYESGLIDSGQETQTYNDRVVSTRWTLSPLNNKDGKVGSVCLVLRDVTSEAETESQLRQAQKMEAVGQLAGGVAHDFNNLLMVIQGCANFMNEDLPQDSPLRDDLNDLIEAAEKAGTLTRQLLTFSRRQKLEPQVLDLNGIVHGVEKMLFRVMREDIRMTIRTCSDPVKVEVDPGQMEQVLVNLAVNARDAMPDGGMLTIETARVDLDQLAARHFNDPRGFKPGSYVMVAVTDTGMGMNADVKAKVFDPFFTTKGKGGTGLGLSTVYGIIKQHHGFMSVYSEESVGSAFKMYLPVCHGDSTADGEGVSGGVEEKGQGTILLVEDEKMVRLIIGRMLDRLGYHVLEAASGREAMRVLSQHAGHVDLLLTDMVMPDMRGDALAQEIRGMFPDIKVMMMSGYPEHHLSATGVSDGFDILTKPVSTSTLAAKVRQAIS